MIKIQLLFFIIFNLILHIGSHFPDIPRPESLFFETNENVQKTVNTLFSELKLTNTFRESLKNKLLVNIHNSFRNITEIYEYNFKQIRNISRVTDNKISVDGALDFNAILDDVIREIRQEPNISSTEKQEVKHDDKLHFDDYNVTFDDSLEFMNDFWHIIKDLKLDDILEPKDKQLPTRRNLKVWDPSDNLNYRRIFKGSQTQIQLYPFLATVHLDGEFVCAGSIISKNLVITAASCLQSVFKKPHNQRAKIRVGSDYATHSGRLTTISEVFFHPSYDPTSLENNLVIARMPSWKNNQANVMIRRISYDKRERKFKDDTDVTILGWGARAAKKVEVSSMNKNILAQANLQIVNFEECRDIFTEKFVTSKNFCAGSKRITEGSGACKNDIGAPVLIKGELVGIVSFGPPSCGTPGIPTVFTKVGLYARWINSVVEKVSGKSIPKEKEITNLNQEDIDNELKSRKSVPELTAAPNVIDALTQALATNINSSVTQNILSTVLSQLSLPNFGVTQSDIVHIINKLFQLNENVKVENQPLDKIPSEKKIKHPKQKQVDKKERKQKKTIAVDFDLTLGDDKTDVIGPTDHKVTLLVDDEILNNESEFSIDIDTVLDNYVNEKDTDLSGLSIEETSGQGYKNVEKIKPGDTRKDLRIVNAARQKHGNVINELERVWNKKWKGVRSTEQIDNFE